MPRPAIFDLILQVKRRSCNVVSTLVLYGLTFACLFGSDSICCASEARKVPEPPLILLMNEAQKQHRKSMWTREIGCKRDLELTLRNYIEGIAHDCYANRHLISKSNDQWLQKILAWHRLKRKGKTHYGSLASEDTLVPRMALTRFAGKNAMELLDDFIEKAGPPSYRGMEKQGDFTPENEQIYDLPIPDLTPGKMPKGVSQTDIFEASKDS